MKERIMLSQLQELTDSQLEKLNEWWYPKPMDVFVNKNFEEWFVVSDTRPGNEFKAYGDDIFHHKAGCYPVMSIGQMIQYVEDSRSQLSLQRLLDDWDMGGGLLADVLWNGVKEILEGKHDVVWVKGTGIKFDTLKQAKLLTEGETPE